MNGYIHSYLMQNPSLKLQSEQLQKHGFKNIIKNHYYL